MVKQILSSELLLKQFNKGYNSALKDIKILIKEYKKSKTGFDYFAFIEELKTKIKDTK
jgi:hypothetical protein